MNNENYSFEKIALLKHAILDVMSEYHDSGKSLRSILREYRLSSGLDDKTLATAQFLTLGAVRFQNTIDFILYRCSNQKFKSLRLRGQILLRICLYWLRWQGMSYHSIAGILVGEDKRLLQILRGSEDFDLHKTVAKLPKIERLSIELSFPSFIVETLLANMEEKEAINLMLDGDSDYFSYMRINQLLSKDESLIPELRGERCGSS